MPVSLSLPMFPVAAKRVRGPLNLITISELSAREDRFAATGNIDGDTRPGPMA
jgi:hypothetical protein